jgi:hypothetical protein
LNSASLRYQKFELQDEARRGHELAGDPVAHDNRRKTNLSLLDHGAKSDIIHSKFISVL